MFSVLGGAATVSATALALAKLKVPYVPICLCLANVLTNLHDSVNLVVLTPLTENLPGPTANKPGDTYVYSYSSAAAQCLRTCCSVYAMNGKSIEIDNTDAEGRLVLSGKVFTCSSRLRCSNRFATQTRSITARPSSSRTPSSTSQRSRGAVIRAIPSCRPVNK